MTNLLAAVSVKYPMLPLAMTYSLTPKQIIGLGISIPVVVTLGMWARKCIHEYSHAQNKDQKDEAMTNSIVAIVLILVVLGFMTWLGIDIMTTLDGINNLKTDF